MANLLIFPKIQTPDLMAINPLQDKKNRIQHTMNLIRMTKIHKTFLKH